MRPRLYVRLFTAALMAGLHVCCSVDFRFIFSDVLMLVLGFTLISVYFVSNGNVFCNRPLSNCIDLKSKTRLELFRCRTSDINLSASIRL